MSKAKSGSAATSAGAALVGAVVVMTVSTGAGLVGSGSVAAASTGTTSTTVVSVPKVAPTAIRRAQGDISKLDTVIADVKAEQESAKSDLGILEEDVSEGKLNEVAGSKLGAPSEDEVSAAVAQLFAAHDNEYADLLAAALHDQFADALAAASHAYEAQPSDTP